MKQLGTVGLIAYRALEHTSWHRMRARTGLDSWRTLRRIDVIIHRFYGAS